MGAVPGAVVVGNDARAGPLPGDAATQHSTTNFCVARRCTAPALHTADLTTTNRLPPPRSIRLSTHPVTLPPAHTASAIQYVTFVAPALSPAVLFSPTRCVPAAWAFAPPREGPGTARARRLSLRRHTRALLPVLPG
jgi:hypothetical protein